MRFVSIVDKRKIGFLQHSKAIPMIKVLTKNLPWRTLCIALERGNEPIQISFWFDGSVYHPLVETLDSWRVPTGGFLLAANAKLIQAVRHAEDWVINNCLD